MSESELAQTVRNMEIYGGGFASALALAFSRADSTNRARLMVAFSDLLEKFGPHGDFATTFHKAY